MLMGVFSFALPVQASIQSASQGVTIRVPSSLSLAGSQSAIDLAFSDNVGGAQTNDLTVTYTVKANGMSQPDGSAAVTAQLDDEIPGIDFKAVVGGYQKQSGNTELGAIAAGPVLLRSSQTVLAAKKNSSGDGRLLDGVLPVTYRAQAREVLQSGTYARQLTLTLTDI